MKKTHVLGKHLNAENRLKLCIIALLAESRRLVECFEAECLLTHIAIQLTYFEQVKRLNIEDAELDPEQALINDWLHSTHCSGVISVFMVQLLIDLVRHCKDNICNRHYCIVLI